MMQLFPHSIVVDNIEFILKANLYRGSKFSVQDEVSIKTRGSIAGDSST